MLGFPQGCCSREAECMGSTAGLILPERQDVPGVCGERASAGGSFRLARAVFNTSSQSAATVVWNWTQGPLLSEYVFAVFRSIAKYNWAEWKQKIESQINLPTQNTRMTMQMTAVLQMTAVKSGIWREIPIIWQDWSNCDIYLWSKLGWSQEAIGGLMYNGEDGAHLEVLT